jgi:phenylacetate-CoA ligase
MTFASKITKHILLPMYKCIQGQPVYAALENLQKVQWLSPGELQARQWQKLQALLQYAYRNVPYYQQIFRDVELEPQDIKTPEDFRRLPYLTKNIIRKYKDDLIAPGQRLRSGSTSGSTGEALWFSISHDESVIRQALFFLGMGWAGLDIGERYAKLWGRPMRQKTSRYQERFEEIKRRVQGCLFLSVYDLSEETLPDYMRRLKVYTPKVMESYVSPLRILGQYLLTHREIQLQLGAIVTSSETLYDHDREFIEKVFGCAVFNRYGSTEFGNVAQECTHHQGLHIYTEHAYVECLKNNRPALPGEKGELVITNLSNYGMPFIRYRIGDYGEMSDRLCDCGRGFPLLESVDGRVFDVVVAPNGGFISGTYWTILFKTVDGIRQFQLIQESVSTLNVKLVTEPAFQMVSLSELEKRIQERCGSAMHIRFELVDDIPLTKAGKRKFIISKVPMNFGNK